jgi:hypothetical protein
MKNNDLSKEDLKKVVEILSNKVFIMQNQINELIKFKNDFEKLKKEKLEENIDFSSFLNDIKVSNDEFNLILLHDFEKGLDEIIETNIEKHSKHPFICVGSKINVYDKGSWTQMKSADIQLIINKIQSQLGKMFSEWRENASLKQINDIDIYINRIYGFNYREGHLTKILFKKLKELI